MSIYINLLPFLNNMSQSRVIQQVLVMASMTLKTSKNAIDVDHDEYKLIRNDEDTYKTINREG